MYFWATVGVCFELQLCTGINGNNRLLRIYSALAVQGYRMFYL